MSNSDNSITKIGIILIHYGRTNKSYMCVAVCLCVCTIVICMCVCRVW